MAATVDSDDAATVGTAQSPWGTAIDAATGKPVRSGRRQF